MNQAFTLIGTLGALYVLACLCDRGFIASLGGSCAQEKSIHLKHARRGPCMRVNNSHRGEIL
jgi:hypothetical protein